MPDRQPVRAEVVVIVQRERLDLRAPERARLIVADRAWAPDVRRAFPQLAELLALHRAEPECVDEQGQRGLGHELA
jgi:hypothetical protein